MLDAWDRRDLCGCREDREVVVPETSDGSSSPPWLPDTILGGVVLWCLASSMVIAAKGAGGSGLDDVLVVPFAGRL